MDGALDPLPRGSALDTLLERTSELKRALVGFTLEHHFYGIFGSRFRDGVLVLEHENEHARLIDEFIASHEDRDGQRVHDRFVASRPDLSDRERALVLAWREPVAGVFRVDGVDGISLELHNEVDDLSYRTLTNAGASALRGVALGSWLIGRLVPLGAAWLMSGCHNVIANRAMALYLAADLARRVPRLALRNPETLRRSLELQRKHHELFVELFGSDLVVVPSDEAEAMHERLIETAQERAIEACRERGETPPDGTRWHDGGWPDGLKQARTVGLFSDAEDGVRLLPDLGDVLAYLDGDGCDPDGDWMFEQLLDDGGGSPQLVRRLVRHNPTRADVIFRRIGGDPSFRWETDGEALLRRLKPSWFRRPVCPSVLCLRKELSAALVAGPPARAEAGRPGLRDRAERKRRSKKRRNGRGRKHR